MLAGYRHDDQGFYDHVSYCNFYTDFGRWLWLWLWTCFVCRYQR